jgi:hypothetical protein
LNERYELGDFIYPAMNAFKSNIKRGIQAARSWREGVGDHTTEELGENIENELQLLDKERSAIYAQVFDESWALNINVHYNEWANFGKDDFRPLVDTYKNLYSLFSCPNCESILYITMIEKKPQNMRCSCGKVNINLNKKEK